jgi:hypothetical protein
MTVKYTNSLTRTMNKNPQFSKSEHQYENVYNALVKSVISGRLKKTDGYDHRDANDDNFIIHSSRSCQKPNSKSVR